MPHQRSLMIGEEVITLDTRKDPFEKNSTIHFGTQSKLSLGNLAIENIVDYFSSSLDEEENKEEEEIQEKGETKAEKEKEMTSTISISTKLIPIPNSVEVEKKGATWQKVKS